MEISLDDKGLKELLTKLSAYENMDKLKNAVGVAAEYVRGNAVELAPVDSGYLRVSIKKGVHLTKNGVEGQIYTNAQYAPYVEFGTGIKGRGTYPYAIKGVNLAYTDKPWVFYDREGRFTKDKDNKFVFTRGQKAQPFMYPAIYNKEKEVMKIIKEELSK